MNMGKDLTGVRSLQRKLMPDNVGPEQHKQTSLRGITDKAKANKQHRFQDFYRVLSTELLLDCFGKLNKDASSGVDGVTWQKYADNLCANVEALVEKLKSKRYRAKLVRRKYIPKENGKERPLGIPVLEDKLLQAACARILNAIYEQDFLAFSYSYRAGRSARDAVQDLTFDLQYGRYGYVVEADIKGFFDNMDHDWLLKMLSQRIDDRAFLGLIRKWLKAGILETDGKVINPDTGTPQGGVVSPVLANVYLHYALDRWFDKVVKPRCGGNALISRYADDFVCAFRFREDAEQFYRELPARLGKFKLEVAPEKTRIIRFSRFHPGIERRFAFLGFEFYWNEDRKGEPRVMRRTAHKKLLGACKRIKEWIKPNRHMPGKEFFRGLNARLRGHYNYYGLRGNSRALHSFFVEALDCTFKWLNRRGGKRRSFTWEKFRKILDAVPIAKPVITEVSRRRVFA
jgi:RNA-directed DNA polymerase